MQNLKNQHGIKGSAIFVHVPAFEAIEEKVQHVFAENLLTELSKQNLD